MKTSIIQKHQFLKSGLLELVSLSELIPEKDHFFVDNFEKWLTVVQGQLKQMQVAEASHFSVFRAILIQAKAEKGRQKRKVLLSKSIDSMKQAQQSLYNLYYPINQKIEQAEELIENLLVIVNEEPDFQALDKSDFSKYINKVWAYILKKEELRPHVNQLKLLVSTTDVFLLLGQKVNL